MENTKIYIPNVIVTDNPATKTKSTLHFILYVDLPQRLLPMDARSQIDNYLKILLLNLS